MKPLALLAGLLACNAAFSQPAKMQRHQPDAAAVSSFNDACFFTNDPTAEVPASGSPASPGDTADLYVQLVTKDSLVAGYPVRYRLIYGNKNTRTATDVKVVFVKSPKARFFKTSSPYTRVSGDTAVWNVGTFWGGSTKIDLDLTLPGTTAITGEAIRATAFIYPSSGDPDTINNTNQIVNLVNSPASSIREMPFSLLATNKPQPGGTASYRLVYGFVTSLDSVKGAIAFVKDPALTFVSSNPAGAVAKGDTVFYDFNKITPGFDSTSVVLGTDTTSIVLDFSLSATKPFGSQIKNKAFLWPKFIDTVALEARDSLTQTLQLWYNSDVTPVTDRQGIQWIKPVSDLQVSSYFISAIDTTSTGAILAAGIGQSQSDQPSGLVLQKISRDGITLYKTFDTMEHAVAVIRIKELRNGNIVVGGTSVHKTPGFKVPLHYGWVRLYDSAGSLKWHRDILPDSSGGAIRQDNYMHDFAIGNEDAVVAVGRTAFVDSAGNTVFSDSTFGQSWVCRINYMGVIRWTKRFADPGGNVLLNAITKANDIGLIVAGYKSRYWPLQDSVLVYKLNEGAGDIMWQKTYSADSYVHIQSIVSVADGYVAAGNTETPDRTQGGWLAKLDVAGNLLWRNTFQAAEVTTLEKVRRDENGGVVCLGTLSNFSFRNHETAAGVFRFDSSGNLLSLKTLSGNEPFTEFRNIAALGNEEYAVAGFLFGNQMNHHYLHPEQKGGVVVKLGNNNTITGTVYLDENGNGKKDASEKYLDGVLVKSERAGLVTSSTTIDGVFKNLTGSGTYITSPVLNNSNFTLAPTADTTVFKYSFETDTAIFAVAPRSVVKDLQVQLLPLTPARPGFTATYKIKYFNAGTTFSNVHVALQKSRNQTYMESTQAGAAVIADTIAWNIGSVAPLAGGEFAVQLRNAAPPVLNNGDTLFLKAIISPAADDATPADNVFSLQHNVQGSFDPNDKQELNNGVYTQEQAGRKEYFHYLIRFQNTGTDTAFRVIVRDTLDKNLDWNTLEVLSFSHAYNLRIKNGNQCEWTFENINLPDSNRNEPGSHGYIAFRIKPKATWTIGDSIRNRASIYFDFNLPVKTNTVRTVFKMATVTAVPNINTINAAISIYPNPTTQAFWTTIKGRLSGTLTVRIYDNQGKLVRQQHHGRINTQVFTTKTTVSGLARGIYFMHIAINGKKSIYKIVVQ